MWSLNIKILKKVSHVNGVCIKPTCDVDLASQSHICLTHSTKQSAVVYQPSDSIIDYQFTEKFVVQHVSVNKWALWGEEKKAVRSI